MLIRPYFIYELIDPRTKAIRYVGITVDPKERYQQHYNANQPNETKNDWISELVELGLAPTMNIRETIMEGEEAAYERERYWIRTYVEQGVNLLNIKAMPLNREKPTNIRHTKKQKSPEENRATHEQAKIGHIISLRRELDARLATPEEGQQLNIPEGTPITVVRDVMLDDRGHVFERAPFILRMGDILEFEALVTHPVRIEPIHRPVP